MWYGKGFNDGDDDLPPQKKKQDDDVRFTARFLNKDNEEPMLSGEDCELPTSISFNKLYQEIDKKENELNELDVEGHIWWNKFRNFLKEIQNGE